MQTSFTRDQLEDPRIAEADRILRSCVHCGLCTATCPTYLLLGDERDSPRGRIYLIKDMLEHGRAADAEVGLHVDRCLSCLSCMTTCPSGVDYMHLIDLARSHVSDTGARGLRDRLNRRLIAAVVPYPGRFRLALLAARLARPLRGLLRGIGLAEMARMTSIAPSGLLRRGRLRLPGTHAPSGPQPPRRTVLMLAGCAQPVLRPEVNDATIRMVNRLGITATAPAGAGCCGALVLHMGRDREAMAQARRTIESWHTALEEGRAEAILVNASGCGTTVKDYAHLFRLDPVMATKAERVAAAARDITEFLAGEELGPPKRWSSLRVAYHAACSMQHGQRLIAEPRQLLRKAGFAVSEVAESHICCGSAGTYSLLQPELSDRLLARKVTHIEQVKPDVVATGNIGCIVQLQRALAVPVVHTVELLDWAYGGPVPRGLEHLKGRAQDVPEQAPSAPLPAA